MSEGDSPSWLLLVTTAGNIPTWWLLSHDAEAAVAVLVKELQSHWSTVLLSEDVARLLSVTLLTNLWPWLWTHCGCTWKHRSQLSQRCITNVGHVNMTITHWRAAPARRLSQTGRGGRSLAGPAACWVTGLLAGEFAEHVTVPGTSGSWARPASLTPGHCLSSHTCWHYQDWCSLPNTQHGSQHRQSQPELESISIMYVNLLRQCYNQMASN